MKRSVAAETEQVYQGRVIRGQPVILDCEGFNAMNDTEDFPRLNRSVSQWKALSSSKLLSPSQQEEEGEDQHNLKTDPVSRPRSTSPLLLINLRLSASDCSLNHTSPLSPAIFVIFFPCATSWPKEKHAQQHCCSE